MSFTDAMLNGASIRHTCFLEQTLITYKTRCVRVAAIDKNQFVGVSMKIINMGLKAEMDIPDWRRIRTGYNYLTRHEGLSPDNATRIIMTLLQTGRL
jgi:hypothetical protein